MGYIYRIGYLIKANGKLMELPFITDYMDNGKLILVIHECINFSFKHSSSLIFIRVSTNNLKKMK